MVLMAGVDQFGGNNDAGPVIEAYKMGVEEHGESKMRARFEESAVRLLTNIFQVGLFENPYLNIEESKLVVGKAEYMKAGFEAQLKSIVMIKNKGNVMPLEKTKKVYISKKYSPARRNFFGGMSEAKWEDPLNFEIVGKYFEVAETPEDADFAIVCVDSPQSGGGYNIEDAKSGEGNGYFPVNLQYNDYTAEEARVESIAGGDPLELIDNRSYQGKTIKTSNKKDLETIFETRKKMEKKPLIVLMNVSNPTVVAEFEALADGICVHFGVQDQVLLEIISGSAEPSALLPLQLPNNMKTVELQQEDVPHDMNCHVDSEGNTYDFAFGMNWTGLITDDRTVKYMRK
jgi:beta-glucosidase